MKLAYIQIILVKLLIYSEYFHLEIWDQQCLIVRKIYNCSIFNANHIYINVSVNKFI